MIDHIAIIMDGNARYASKLGKSVKDGHRAGAENSKQIIEHAARSGVKNLTLYTFSAENWYRPEEEVNHLMWLFGYYLDQYLGELVSNNIRIIFMGDLSKIDPKLKAKMRHAEEISRNNSQMNLYLALSYGSRQEICEAVRKIVAAGVSACDIGEETIKQYLYNGGAPDPDLIIRTGGDYRLSNFLLWQAAYSELYFSYRLWPEFSCDDFDEVMREYENRVRKFGSRAA